MTSAADRLDLLKTLGDNTRYAIYLEIARSPSPLSTAEIAESLGLHHNTVRPHLERMREVGLVDSRPDTTGSVGRPQHLFSLAEDAPSLGLEPPVFPMLARMLMEVARESRVDPDLIAGAGRSEGRRRVRSIEGLGASRRTIERGHEDEAGGGGPMAPAGLSAAVEMQEQFGFDPALVGDDDTITMAFAHCPFAELAQRSPDVICALHRGLVEGSLEDGGDFEVLDFRDLSDRRPCQVDLVRAVDGVRGRRS